MNSSPVDTYEGASDIFTFGAGSVGMWIFLILAAAAFVGMIVYTISHESHAFSEMGPYAGEATTYPVSAPGVGNGATPTGVA